MKQYFSTFTTGFKDVINESLQKFLRDIHIDLITDGVVIYRTNADMEQIKNLGFLNNSFIVIKYFNKLSNEPTKQMIKSVLSDPSIDNFIASLFPHRRTTFRIIVKEDRIVPIDRNVLKKLEDKISRNTQLSVNRSLPQYEFWFLIRREGFGLFGVRITKRPNYEKTLEKGELYPEFANILCLISEPSANDVFLDPFAGSGSISLQRARVFMYKQIFAGDSDPKLVDKLRIKVKKSNPKIIIGKWDALHLRTFQNESVHTIVTDPPWGLHSGTSLNLPKFYSEMLTEFHRVLKVKGLMIILVAKKELFEEVLSKFKDKIEIEVKYDTLVSGQKAGVYKIRKIKS